MLLALPEALVPWCWASSPPQQTDEQTFIILPMDSGCCMKHPGHYPTAAGGPALLAGIALVCHARWLSAGRGAPAIYLPLPAPTTCKSPFPGGRSMAPALQRYVPPSVPLPVLGRAPCRALVQAVPSPPRRSTCQRLPAGLQCRPARLPPALELRAMLPTALSGAPCARSGQAL